MLEEELKKHRKIDELATDVLNVSKNTLLAHLRFLDVALNKFVYMPTDNGTLKTNGKFLIYNPKYVLRCYKAEKERPVRDYLHMVLHCVFSHMYSARKMDQPIWDLSCDMAVEFAILGLGLAPLSAKREREQKMLLEPVVHEVGEKLTAERIYRYFLTQDITLERVDYIRSFFEADDHDIWYQEPEKIQVLDGEGKEGGEKDPDPGFEPEMDPIDKDTNSDESSDLENEDQEMDKSGENRNKDTDFSPDKHEEEEWKKISKRMQVEIETMHVSKSDISANLLQNLISVNREKYDYESFLKKFAVRKEIMKINDEEFDYVYYTYGLKLYEAMPLIEPLEYKEVKRIKEFVIAIDVSYSVSGELVHKFAEKTFNILKSTESFFAEINLHIILCDAEIKRHVKITNQDEFDEFFNDLELGGFGGTDFRPVFKLMDELIQAGEFENLKGLIYFTDGEGIYPDTKPKYETAFVFVDNDDRNIKVPGWAIKLVLAEDEV